MRCRTCGVGALFAAFMALGLAAFHAPAATRAQEPAGLVEIQPASLAELRDWDLAIDRMVRDDSLRVRQVMRDGQLAGRSHERLDQFHDGVRVVGGDIARQIDRGTTVSIFGGVYRGIALDVEPGLTPGQALTAARQAAGVQGAGGTRPVELVVLPLDAGGYALAYRTSVFTGTDLLAIYVDARDGRELLRYSELARQSVVGTGTGVVGDTKKVSAETAAGGFAAHDLLRPADLGTFDMRANLPRTLAALDGLVPLGAGDLAIDSDNQWGDAATVDAHVYTGWTYDYFFRRFNRRGLNDANIPVRSIVHTVDRDDVFTTPPNIVGLFFLNAFFCPRCAADGTDLFVYGEGLPPGLTIPGPAGLRQSWDFLSGALDVVAHEVTHGVTSYSSRLQSRNEPGALNEGFSDMMGSSVEFFFEGSRQGGATSPDYEIGEDAIRPGGLRSMSNPQSLGGPDHYTRRFIGAGDAGGIHINATIPGHAFFLAIEGGRNRTSGLTVEGVGAANREQIEQVFYRAFVFMLPSNATFLTARGASIQAARDLFGAGSPAERAVTQAWNAVGVVPASTGLRFTFEPNPAPPLPEPCFDNGQRSWGFRVTVTETAGVGFQVSNAAVGFYNAAGDLLGRQAIPFAEFFDACGGSGARIAPNGRRCSDICVALGGLPSGAIDVTLLGTNGRGVPGSFTSARLRLLAPGLAGEDGEPPAGPPEVKPWER